MTDGAGLKRYLQEAFQFRWNLLFLGATSLGAVLSGHVDVFLPAVLAVELLYLAGLVSAERFRALVDSKVVNEGQAVSALQGQAERNVQAANLLASLELPRAGRLKRLQQRCIDMRFLARHVGGGARASQDTDFSSSSLDRLFWVFLKLLVSQQALERFLRSTDASVIAQQLRDFQSKLQSVPESDERLRTSLADAVNTAQLRLTNYDAARRNAQFVDVELDRLEAKIQALSEMSVSNEDPNYISSQVDAIAQAMAETEAEMRELDNLTGMIGEQDAPELVGRDLQNPR